MAAEKRYENQIKQELKKMNAYHVKYFGCAFTQAGVPDILSCVNGHFLAIEVKAEKGRASDLQKRNIHMITKSGGIAVICKPADFEDLKHIIFYLTIDDLYQARKIASAINVQYLN